MGTSNFHDTSSRPCCFFGSHRHPTQNSAASALPAVPRRFAVRGRRRSARLARHSLGEMVIFYQLEGENTNKIEVWGEDFLKKHPQFYGTFIINFWQNTWQPAKTSGQLEEKNRRRNKILGPWPQKKYQMQFLFWNPKTWGFEQLFWSLLKKNNIEVSGVSNPPASTSKPLWDPVPKSPPNHDSECLIFSGVKRANLKNWWKF